MTTIYLSDLSAAQGFKLLGSGANTYTGYSVAVGDFNADGQPDLLVGAIYISAGNGGAYLLYGVAGGFANPVDLASLTSGQGFRIDGIGPGAATGWSVARAGDLNQDGYQDFIIGSPEDSVGTGRATILYGSGGTVSGPVDLAMVSGTAGYQIFGAAPLSFAGNVVGSIGDINSDGFTDLLVTAPGSAGGTGAAFVVYGQAGGSTGPIDLATLTTAQGFRIDGIAAGDRTGFSAAGIGDFNADGTPDIALGAYGVDGERGAVHVVYGPGSGTLDLANLDPTEGFRIDGAAPGSRTGYSVAAAGDFNDDGHADLLVGAPRLNTSYGAAYVIYGRSGGFAGPLDLATLTPEEGLRIDGGDGVTSDTGHKVASAGDVNGDGIADIIVGAFLTSFVVFGHRSGWGESLSLDALTATQGFRVQGNNIVWAVGAAGDQNGDGLDDVFVTENGPTSAGIVNVIYGLAAPLSEAGTADDERMRGAAAADSLAGLDGADTLFGNAGADTLDGGAGNDSIDDGAGDDIASGGSGHDSMRSGAGNDLLSGADGDDQLVGGPGADTLVGGAGDDSYTIWASLGAVGTRVVEAASGGIDIIFADAGIRLAGGVENLQIDFASASRSYGNALANLMAGNAGAETFYGLDGADTLSSGGGIDRLFGGTGNDSLGSDAGTDQLRGETGADTLSGGADADLLSGGADADLLMGDIGNDRLFGDPGNDTLEGGYGLDLMAGGTGADAFRFALAPMAIDADRISDFLPGTDRLELALAAFDPAGTRGLVGGSLATQPAHFAANLTGLATQPGVAQIIFETDAGRVWWDADGIGGAPRILLVTLLGAPPLTAGDVLFV